MIESCAKIEELLSDFLEGAVAPETAAGFSAHLDTCGDCATLVAQVRDLTGHMHALSAVAEPPYLASRIVATTAGVRESGWREWLAWPSLIWQPQFAMGAVTVVATLVILLHVTVGSADNLTLADMNPVSVARVANRHAHLAYAHGVKFVNDLRLVYAIESRLASPEPVNAPEHREQPAPPLDPRQKSHMVPREGGDIQARQTAAPSLEANLMFPARLYRSAP